MKVFFFSAVGAQVSLTMEDVVEVYKGDSAVIRCQYSFAQHPNMVMVQWFVVRTNHLYDAPTNISNELVVLPP